jgi:hypothetical protein
LLASRYSEGLLTDVIVILAPTYAKSGNWPTDIWSYWFKSLGVNFPVVADGDQALAKHHGSGKPAYLLVDLATMKIQHKQVSLTGDLPGLLGI